MLAKVVSLWTSTVPSIQSVTWNVCSRRIFQSLYNSVWGRVEKHASNEITFAVISRFVFLILGEFAVPPFVVSIPVTFPTILNGNNFVTGLRVWFQCYWTKGIDLFCAKLDVWSIDVSRSLLIGFFGFLYVFFSNFCERFGLIKKKN